MRQACATCSCTVHAAAFAQWMDQIHFAPPISFKAAAWARVSQGQSSLASCRLRAPLGHDSVCWGTPGNDHVHPFGFTWNKTMFWVPLNISGHLLRCLESRPSWTQRQTERERENKTKKVGSANTTFLSDDGRPPAPAARRFTKICRRKAKRHGRGSSRAFQHLGWSATIFFPRTCSYCGWTKSCTT